MALKNRHSARPWWSVGPMNSMAFAWLLALSGLIVGNGAHAQDVTAADSAEPVHIVIHDGQVSGHLYDGQH